MLESVIAPNVRDIINNRCLKQSLVAQKAGYTKQQFNDMLMGRKVIRDTDVMRIATALEVDANTLFGKSFGQS